MSTFLQTLERQPEYIHVLLNPLPIYGLAMSLVGLVVAFFLRSRRAQITTLILLLVSAGSAWPVYEFGEEGYDRVLSMSDDAGRAWLDEHQHRAEQLIWCFYALAIVSAIAIALPIRWPKTSPPLVIVTILFGLIVLGMSAYIGYAGGKVRHKEFRTAPPPAPRSTAGQS